MLLETKVATNSLTETQKQANWQSSFTNCGATNLSLVLIDLHRLQASSDLGAVTNTPPNHCIHLQKIIITSDPPV